MVKTIQNNHKLYTIEFSSNIKHNGHSVKNTLIKHTNISDSLIPQGMPSTHPVELIKIRKN